MTYNNLLSTLSEDARVWIYPVDKKLTPSDVINVEASLNQFIQNWHSHGRKVTAEATILYDRFIVIGAEIPEAEISGCGIDASVHAVEAIGNQSGFSVLTGLTVFFKDEDGSIQHLTRSQFRTSVRNEEITSDTLVIDPSITQISQLKEGSFELPAGSSWHATVFRIPPKTN